MSVERSLSLWCDLVVAVRHGRGKQLTDETIKEEVEKPLVEVDMGESDDLDPDASPPKSRKLFTQPYDLTLKTLVDQIDGETLHLRPLSGKPAFQRRYVWSDRLASRLVESILLNVPIPPCYFAQDEDFALEVIDGQQRIYSIYRFIKNQFRLGYLETVTEANGSRFFELENKIQNRLLNHTLRCVVITNDSDEELRFDVFERLNSNTVPLNPQELRNCVYRGTLIELVGTLVEYKPWLKILRRSAPDKRMRDEELILRFFAFQQCGLSTYRTPQKHWLNDVARWGRRISDSEAEALGELWRSTVDKALLIFRPEECFRRIQPGRRSTPINKALMDLHMITLARTPVDRVKQVADSYKEKFAALLNDSEFDDLISRSIDHRTRTNRRFEIWEQAMGQIV